MPKLYRIVVTAENATSTVRSSTDTREEMSTDEWRREKNSQDFSRARRERGKSHEKGREGKCTVSEITAKMAPTWRLASVGVEGASVAGVVSVFGAG